jgi:hypothetical protein
MKSVKFSEQELVDVFQVEELEKRYEMGWLPDSGTGKGTYNEKAGFSVEVSATWKF